MVEYQTLSHEMRGTVPSSNRHNGLTERNVTRYAAYACVSIALLLSGCYRGSVLPQSEGHLVTPAVKPALENVPPPARISTFVPAPKPAIKPLTYSVVVSEVPVKELLFALARDSKQNIDIHPG